MKFTVACPKPPDPPAPISINAFDRGGFEGVQIEVSSTAGFNGRCEGLMAIDPFGNAWTGESYSIKMGKFQADGSFVWELKD